jgi:aldehyde dehydrogenase (NAD+)
MDLTPSIYIDGEWTITDSDESFIVRNPADTDDVIGEFQAGTERDVDRAVEAAAAALPAWSSTPAGERASTLREVGGYLEERRSVFAEVLTREEGKPRSEAESEVQRASDIFRYYAGKALDYRGTTKSPPSRNAELYTVREPVGVATVITPWNYPVGIPAWKIAPALATGNTVVWKPAVETASVSRLLLEYFEEAGLPAGVLNAVTGGGEAVGAPLTTHEGVDAVSFTGSTAVGRQVYDAATDDMKRVQCEMGGKNPTVVTESADLELAVDVVAGGAFGGTGQSCTACSRAIVDESVAEEFLENLVRYAEGLEIGPGESDPDVAPQVSASERDGTLKHVERATVEGATLATGGGVPEGERFESGYYVEPTVFTDVEPEMHIAREEVFGPVVAVLTVDGFEEALAVANDVDYGLSASIVTEDLREAHRFLAEIEAGVAKVNEKTTGLAYHVPFGGLKDSSSTTWREQGDAGLDFYTVSRTMYLNY